MTVAARKKPTNLLYQGSVKNVWQSPEADERLWFQFTDDYSVFDWGKMPDTIERKGASLTLLGSFFFELLSKPDFWQKLPGSPALAQFDQEWLSARFKHRAFSSVYGLAARGLTSHYIRLTDGSVNPLNLAKLTDEQLRGESPLFLDVREAKVGHPTKSAVLGKDVYFYPVGSLVKDAASGLALIPLEIVFRFGMPQGSSLKGRLEKNPHYLAELGLSKMPVEGKWFEHPVLEFFTKLESKDRLLSYQEASTIAGLTPEHFEQMVEVALDIALALFVVFGNKGIELWDGKVEMLLDGRANHVEQSIVLADSIGPDELRLLYKGQHLSKEIIRIYYRGSKWETAVKESQDECAKNGISDWKKYCDTTYKLEPEPLTPSFKAAIDQMYCVLVNHVSGVKVFKDCPDIDQFLVKLQEALAQQGAGK